MNKFYVFILVATLAAGCSKEPQIVPPVSLPLMNYVDLNDRQIKFNETFICDVNGDGSKDVSFNTLLVGDPILKRDYKQYRVASSFFTALPVNDQEQIPVLSKDSVISATAHAGYEWSNASSIVLAQKIISETGPGWWDGEWKAAAHKFIPIRVAEDSLLYYGWVEISFDSQTENIILHKAAISKEAGKEVKAGV